MSSRYRSLALYSGLVAVLAALWLVQELLRAPRFPPWWAALFAIGACLFVWHFGLTAPRVVLTSMERLPQIGALLIFDPAVAAAVCAVASLLWPFTSRAYSYGSFGVATLRGLHNAGMTAIMLLVGGKIYLAAGGEHPLVDLGMEDVLPLVLMALAVQAVNIGAMALYYLFDGRDVRRLIHPVHSLVDLLFVPAGVLAALLANAGMGATFGLFVGLMVVFALSFNRVGQTVNAVESQRRLPARLGLVRRPPHGLRRLDVLGERIVAETRALFRFDEFRFGLVDREHDVIDLRVHERDGQRQPAQRVPLRAGLLGWLVGQGEAVRVENWNAVPDALRRHATQADLQNASLLLAPLVDEGTVIGLLDVRQRGAGGYSAADLHLIRHLAEQVSGAVADARAFEDLEAYRQGLEERVAERTRELEEANRDKERLIAVLDERGRALERQSQEDPLTGIANRRCFDQRLVTELAAAHATGHPLTLAVADLDHFKVVNDRLGHAVGDDVLRHAAELMRRSCRGTDLVARIGGEEFAILLSGMTGEIAAGYCDMLRIAFESYDWAAVHPDLDVTVSIGVSQWDGASDPVALLQAADARLYVAKNAGRNRVA